jgi:hypothetical protein
MITNLYSPFSYQFFSSFLRLFKTEGSLLGAAGTEADRAPIVAAIVSNIWSSYEKGGDSSALLIDNEVIENGNFIEVLFSSTFVAVQRGKIVVVKISKLLLAVYGGENVDFGILRAKVRVICHRCSPA